MTAPGDLPRSRLHHGVVLLLVGVLALAAAASAGHGVALARTGAPALVSGAHHPALPGAHAAVVDPGGTARSRRAVRQLAAGPPPTGPVLAPRPGPGASVPGPSPGRADPDDGLRLEAEAVGERFPPRAPPRPVRA